uniref:Ig-like domain-containing protein n=1 Tax=Latimeria chalumnae TaxID=7897 RepID=H2ZZM1_LATCH
LVVLFIQNEQLQGKVTHQYIIMLFYTLFTEGLVTNEHICANLWEDTTLTCTVNTKEIVAQVTWQRKREPQNENFLTYFPGKEANHLNDFGRRVKFIGGGMTDGSIIIPYVTLADEDVYICIFTLFPSGPLEEEIVLEVSVPPITYADSNPNPPVVGSDKATVAICTAVNGKPGAMISWQTSLNYTTDEKRTRHKNGTETMESQLQMIPRMEIHQQNVYCVVQHCTLKTPAIVPVMLNIYYPPSVTMYVVQKDNGNLELICADNANPPATNKCAWFRDNAPIPASISVTENGHLNIVDLNSNINGLYWCDAMNPYGKSSGVLYL